MESLPRLPHDKTSGNLVGSFPARKTSDSPDILLVVCSGVGGFRASLVPQGSISSVAGLAETPLRSAQNHVFLLSKNTFVGSKHKYPEHK